MSDANTEFKPNLEKLRKLQQSSSSVLIGGKGVPRRKKKVVHKTATTDEKKLQSSLKKLTVNNIQGIDEVNMFKDNGEVLHFNNPKVQASLASNIFAISGHADTKPLTDLLPGIMNQLGAENVWSLKNLAKTLQASASDETAKLAAAGGATLPGGDDDDEDVPQLVENFDEVAKKDETADAEAK